MLNHRKTHVAHLGVMFWVLVLLSVLPLRGEITRRMLTVHQLGYEQGLSSERVFSIVEDADGAMWFASKMGIDRYNGQTVTNHPLMGEFSYGDMAGRRLLLLFDEKYGLYAYDQTGRIYRFNASTKLFEPQLEVRKELGHNVTLSKLVFDKDGRLWIALECGLWRQDANGKLQPVLQDVRVNDVLFCGKSVYVGTDQGAWRMEAGLPSRMRPLLEHRNVQTLLYDEVRNELWMGTYDGGLVALQMSTWQQSEIGGDDPAFSHPIRALLNYDKETVLAGVDGGGVYTVDKHSKRSHLLMNTQDDSEACLCGNGVYSMVKDRQGNIWVGSYTGGVTQAVVVRNPITVLLHEKGNDHSLASNNVNDVMGLPQDQIWYATDNGVSIQQTRANEWNHVLQGLVTVSLTPAENGAVWVGTYGDGVYKLDAHGRVLCHLTRQAGALTSNYVSVLWCDADYDLWVGGYDGYLTVHSPNGSLQRTFGVRWSQSLAPCGPSRVAVATVNGFYVMDKASDQMQRYAMDTELQHFNASAYVMSLCFNADSTLWLGTDGGGLALYDMKQRKVQAVYTKKDGLPSDDVCSISRDGNGRLWLCTRRGIAMMDSTGFTNMNYAGALEREYNKQAATQLGNGTFVFGSTEGAVLLNPLSVSQANYDAPLRFTDWNIEYKDSLEALTQKTQLWQMLQQGVVRLDYAHNSFDVSFESINYRYQRDVVYQYCLEGYDNTWSTPQPVGMASYTRVAPGSYTLRIRNVRRSDGKVIHEAQTRVMISEPWWNTWWAWMAYAAMIAGVFYFILRYYSNQLQKEYDEDKIRFFVNTAHDIRTPVALIMGPLEDMSRDESLPAKVRYYLDLARQNTQKLHDMISQLLEFEKVDSSKRKDDYAPIEMGGLLQREVDTFRHACEKKGLYLNVSMPDAPIYVCADVHLLNTVFDNLLSNAVKYTQKGGVTLDVKTSLRKVTLLLRDTGMGIPNQAKHHIFQDIYRADNARSSQSDGTGFGLVQVARIVKLLRGKISYKSVEGKGTVFMITLPRVSAPATAPALIDQAAPSTLTASLLHEVQTPVVHQPQGVETPMSDDASRNTLLIVEDHEALRYYLRQTFEPDYRVLEAADGVEALEVLKVEYPDLILSDVMMPRMQGDALCHEVKSNADTAGIPFVLLTAKVNHDAMVQGLKLGADDYIPKPFSTEILKLKVQGLIANRNRMRAWLMRHALSKVTDTPTGVCAIEPVLAESPNDAEVASLVPPMTPGDQHFVDQATRCVLAHLDDSEFNIAQLCQEMAMSRTLFYGRLKSLTGQGPQEFVRTLRLQKSTELLQQGLSVNEVALMTGFGNAKYFSVAFKKHFGVQPSKYE